MPPLTLSTSVYRRVNAAFAFACFAMPPVLGSVTSFAVNLGSLAGLFNVATRQIPFAPDPAMRRQMWTLLAYCAVYLVSFAINPFVVADFRYLPMVLAFLAFPFLYSSVGIADKETLARWAALGAMAACYGAVAISTVEFHVLGRRAAGAPGNATLFASVVTLAAGIALGGAFLVERRLRLAMVGAFLAGIVATFHSGTRTAWVAILLSAAVVLFANRRALVGRLTPRVALMAAAGAIAVTALAYQPVATRMSALADDWVRLEASGDYSTSLGQRVLMWRTGLARVAENPFLGQGPQATRPTVRRVLFEERGIEVGHSHFHNGFLTAAVESGLIGMATLTAVFAVPALLAIRVLRSCATGPERFGATTLGVTVTSYIVLGMTGILVGQDLLDALLVYALAVGTFLAAGTPGTTVADGGG